MEKLKFIPFEKVLKEELKNPAFRKGFTEEVNRLRLAYQIKVLRQKKNMTQKQVAAKASMPQSVVARIESGKHPVSLATLYRIAHVFNKQIALVDR
ncbi:MAG: helix-turn-helix transcriptional regulator [Minisyncoccia bacterium]|jgi:DNA-binding XRE family transcriptional regulator